MNRHLVLPMKSMRNITENLWFWKVPVWRRCLGLLTFAGLFGYVITGLVLDHESTRGLTLKASIPFIASAEINALLLLLGCWAVYIGVISGPKTKRPID